MRLEITEKQLKDITKLLNKEEDVAEQDEPVSAEPKSGTSDYQSGGGGYPEVGKWETGIERGVANQIGNTKWADGIEISRGKANPLKEYVFDAHMTTNGRFLIFQDEVFDIQEQTTLGNIWDSIDTFKTIFSKTECDKDGYKEIQEGVANLPILESEDNLHILRDILIEDNWVSRQFKDFGQKAVNTSKEIFSKDTWEKAKRLGVSLSKGDWDEVGKLLTQGAVYIVRKLRNALYSNVGMVVDAILIATGIGKAYQFAMWALVVGLDIYELSTGDHPPDRANDPKWVHYMGLAFDIMAMVVAGGVGKALRAFFSPLFAWVKKGGKVGTWFAKNPKAAQKIKEVMTKVDKAPNIFKRAMDLLKSKFPKGGEFLKGIHTKLGGFLTNMKTVLGNLVKNTSTGVKKVGAAVASGGIIGGLAYVLDPNKKGDPEYDMGAYIDQRLDAAF